MRSADRAIPLSTCETHFQHPALNIWLSRRVQAPRATISGVRIDVNGSEAVSATVYIFAHLWEPLLLPSHPRSTSLSGLCPSIPGSISKKAKYPTGFCFYSNYREPTRQKRNPLGNFVSGGFSCSMVTTTCLLAVYGAHLISPPIFCTSPKYGCATWGLFSCQALAQMETNGCSTLSVEGCPLWPSVRWSAQRILDNWRHAFEVCTLPIASSGLSLIFVVDSPWTRLKGINLAVRNGPWT